LPEFFFQIGASTTLKRQSFGASQTRRLPAASIAEPPHSRDRAS